MKDRILVAVICAYLKLVFATSKVTVEGNINYLAPGSEEKFTVGFWHGDVLPFYPLFRDSGIAILTTINRRGDYIAGILEKFGYTPLRAPDESDGGNHVLRLVNSIKNEDKHMALTLDGPLGPYHEPKRLIIIMAKAAKRRIIPISVRVTGAVHLKKRWDNYLIPLPFSRMVFCISEPIETARVSSSEIISKIVCFLDGDEKKEPRSLL